jgi:thiosulfate reductase cytochrome b subunit
MGRRPQPLAIRLLHWINVPLLAIMAGSGLQIWHAYPRSGPVGQPYRWFPWNGWDAPKWAKIGHWLAGARHWHFAVAWLLVGNALVYLIYLFATGEFRRRWFWPKRDAGNAVQTILYYLRIRKHAPEQGLYNGLQRAAYLGAMGIAVLEVLSGFAIWKPTQLRSLAWFFGGYDGARAVHFLGLMALVAFLLGHLVMVAIHWRSSIEMVTGGKAKRDE